MNYILLTFVTYLGLFLGTIVSIMSIEELKYGRKYFKILKNLMFSLSIYLFIQKIISNYFISIPISTLLFFALFKIEHKKTPPVMYTFLAFSFYELKNNFINSIIIFIFGVALSSQKYRLKKSKIQNIFIPLIKNIHFVIIAIILFYLNI